MIQPNIPDEIDQAGSVGPYDYKAWTTDSPTGTYVKYVVRKGGKLVEGKTTRYRQGRTRIRSRPYHTCDSLDEVEPSLVRLRIKRRCQKQDRNRKRPLSEQLYTLYREGVLTVYTRPHNDLQHDEPGPHDMMRTRRVGPYRNELDPARVETFETDLGTHHRIKKDWEMHKP